MALGVFSSADIRQIERPRVAGATPLQPAPGDSTAALLAANRFGHRFERISALAARPLPAPIQRARKRQRYGVTIEDHPSDSSRIGSVRIQSRPAFNAGTKRALARRYTDEHTGTRLDAGYSRNHIVAWQILKSGLSQHLQGKKKSEIQAHLDSFFAQDEYEGINYKPKKSGSAAERIKHAGRVLFNNVDNLRIGDSSQNSSDGSRMRSEIDRFGRAYAVSTPRSKPKLYADAKREVKRFGIDSSPTTTRAIEGAGSPLVKGALNARADRPGFLTPPSAKVNRVRGRGRGRGRGW